MGGDSTLYTQAKHHLACLYSSVWRVKQDLVSVHSAGGVFQGARAALTPRSRRCRGFSYVDRFVAGVFDSDPGLLNHVQIGPRHHQGGVAAERKKKKRKKLHNLLFHRFKYSCLSDTSSFLRLNCFLFLIQRYKKRNKVKEEKETEQFKDSLAPNAPLQNIHHQSKNKRIKLAFILSGSLGR